MRLAAAPDRFSHLLCRNVDEHALCMRAGWARDLDRHDEAECPSYDHTTGKTLLPSYAAELVAAHLARRRADGSGSRGRFFVDPRDPALDASDRSLTEVILRACRRVGANPFWLHRGFCDVSGIGGGPAALLDWMTARRMDVVILSGEGPDR
ncbi:hypothetical protein ACFP1Z_28585 [Streptomyces gamaensis]|uniref:Uncharacterized protein n=1 Tax=Streptomyces gamaensis TaxID=1763542 RepID=A0ABW0Z8H2_9ACTN